MQVSKGALLAAAVSDDGRFFAAGGGQGLVHLWDARSREHIKVGSAASRPLSSAAGPESKWDQALLPPTLFDLPAAW